MTTFTVCVVCVNVFLLPIKSDEQKLFRSPPPAEEIALAFLSKRAPTQQNSGANIPEDGGGAPQAAPGIRPKEARGSTP